MKRSLSVLLTVIFASLLIVTCTACINKKQSGELKTETYEVTGATSFKIEHVSLKKDGFGTGPTVEFVNDGGDPSVTVTMQESLFKYVKLDQKNNAITFSGSRLYTYETDYDVTLTVKNCVFNDIRLSGATKGTADSGCIGENFSLDLSGASSFRTGSLALKNFDLEASGASSVVFESIVCPSVKIDLSGASFFSATEIDATDIDADESGASSVSISGGVATKASVKCSGASSFKAQELVTNETKVKLSGASSVYVCVNSSLTGSASGASDVYYKGEAQVSVDTSGSSQVHKIS